MYLLAVTIPVSLAATNVAKLIILLACIAALAMAARTPDARPACSGLSSVTVALLMLGAMAISLLYTTAPMPEALSALGKYGKLLIIPAVLLLIRDRREAALAMGLHLGVQALVVITSWLLYLHAPVFWVSPLPRNSVATVYSSYLDQSIMTAAFAAMCWHLRHEFPGRRGPLLACLLAALAVVNVLVMLPGRSGHMATIAVLSLALLWATPRRWRPAMVLAPVVLLGVAMAASTQFNQRLTQVVNEVGAYQAHNDASTSSGQRLNFWHRSLQAIAERPFTGFGVGSWHQQYTRLEGGKPSPGTAEVRNPHQEYLLWGVQLGVGGIALFLAFIAALVRDSRGFAIPVRRATQSVVAVMAVACLFNSSLFDALIGEYFCIVLGLLLALGLRGQAPATVTVQPAVP